MNERAFEEVLRSTLRAAAPLEVPARLENRARAIPSAVPVRRSWLPRVPHLRTRAAIGAILVAAVVIASVVLVAPRTSPSIGGGVPNPVQIESPFGSLVASDLELIVNGRVFRVLASLAEPGVQTLTFTGSSTYGRLTVAWRDGDSPLTLVVHFAATARTWWVSEIVASDGRAEEAGWVYFEGPLFERPLGSAFGGTVELSSVRSTYGETGSLRFGELSLRAFASSTPRDPTRGTMPPSDGTTGSSGPDFISTVGGDQIVGYVPKQELDESVPINSFRGQDPDQPVYGDDLKTLVGYMVPSKGFVPRGVDPALVPTIPVQQGPAVATPAGPSTSLTLYVRSATAETAWFAVVPASDAGGAQGYGAQGYNIGVGVGCLDVPIGGQLVMVDRPPQDAGAITLRVIYHRARANGQPTLWVDIGADGTVRQGTGVPPWWTSAPQGC